MENKQGIIKKIQRNIRTAHTDLDSFNHFVNDSEYFFELYGLGEYWFELEILNALALSDWEKMENLFQGYGMKNIK